MERTKDGRKPPRSIGEPLRLSPDEIREGIELSQIYWGQDKPKKRKDCINGIRPCPYVSCRYHLFLSVRPTTKGGRVRVNWPLLESPADMRWSCALDEAERGGLTLEELGKRLNITRERARQIEGMALQRIRTMARYDKRLQLLVELFEAAIQRPEAVSQWDLF